MAVLAAALAIAIAVLGTGAGLAADAADCLGTDGSDGAVTDGLADSRAGFLALALAVVPHKLRGTDAGQDALREVLLVVGARVAGVVIALLADDDHFVVAGSPILAVLARVLPLIVERFLFAAVSLDFADSPLVVIVLLLWRFWLGDFAVPDLGALDKFVRGLFAPKNNLLASGLLLDDDGLRGLLSDDNGLGLRFWESVVLLGFGVPLQLVLVATGLALALALPLDFYPVLPLPRRGRRALVFPFEAVLTVFATWRGRAADLAVDIAVLYELPAVSVVSGVAGNLSRCRPCQRNVICRQRILLIVAKGKDAKELTFSSHNARGLFLVVILKLFRVLEPSDGGERTPRSVAAVGINVPVALPLALPLTLSNCGRHLSLS